MRILRAENFSERGQLVRELDINRNHADKGGRAPHNSAIRNPQSSLAGFTMVEIAICLAVIGFALVAIIGVLPIGMSVQKENREDTIINFDANYLMDAIRSGARGLDNLTNYVVVITNSSTLCSSNGVPYGKPYINLFTQTGYSLAGNTNSSRALTNGALVMALLSLPKYIPATDPVIPHQPGDYWSNYVSADFRAITGSPLDQGTSQSSKDFAFTYRVTVEIVPSASYPYYSPDPNLGNFSAPGQLTNAPNTNQVLNGWQYAKNLQANMYDIRLRFRWPVLPGGKLGNGNRVFRSSESGEVTNFTAGNISTLFVSAPGDPPLLPAAPFYTYYLLQPQTYSVAQ